MQRVREDDEPQRDDRGARQQARRKSDPERCDAGQHRPGGDDADRDRDRPQPGRPGAPGRLPREVREDAADLVSLAPRGRTPTGKALFGSVTQQVLLETDRPVLVSGAGTASD